MSSYDLVVIGGGISGLVAAYEAKKAGLSVILYEQNKTLGGCLKSKSILGFTLETGANTIALNEATTKLIDELKLDSELIYPAIPKYKQYIWDTKLSKPIALPKNPISLVTCKLFSLSDKINIIKGLFKKIQPSEFDTIDDFFSKLLGFGATQKAISPALRGIFGGNSSKLLAIRTFPTIFDAINKGQSLFGYAIKKKPKRKIFALKNGNSSIIERLFDVIGQDSFQNAAVQSINKLDSNFEITSCDGQTVIAKKIAIATSGQCSANIIKNVVPKLSSELNNLTFAPIVSIHFSLKSKISELDKGFGVLFPFNSGSRIIGVLCNSTLFPHTAPSGEVLITVCLGGVGLEELLYLAENELVKIATDELLKFFNIQNPTHLLTTYWKKAIPQFTKETVNLENLFVQAENEIPQIVYIGVDRGKIGVPDRIEYVTSRMKSFLAS